MSSQPVPSQPKSGQERAIRRRAAILDATVRLILKFGMSAVSHRAVAAEAEVPLGSIRYYFDSREVLLLACVDHLDAARSAAAQDAIRRATDSPVPVDIARLALYAYYGPDLDDATLIGTVGWVADCSRESPILSSRLTELRTTLDHELRQLLDASGHGTLPTRLVSAIIDGSLFISAAESRRDIASRAVEDLEIYLEQAHPSDDHQQ